MMNVLVVLMTALVMSVLLIWWFDVTTLHCINCMRILLVVLHFKVVFVVDCLISCIDFSGLMHACTLY